MANNLEDLTTRINKCRVDFNYATRKRDEDVKTAIKIIASIPEEDVTLLEPIVPSLRIIKGYTEQQLSENLHDEIGTVRDTVQALKNFIEGRLKYLEEQL